MIIHLFSAYYYSTTSVFPGGAKGFCSLYVLKNVDDPRNFLN